MTLQERINSFVKLGNEIVENIDTLKQEKHNPWFTENNIKYALTELINSLKSVNIEKWASHYPTLQIKKDAKRIGVITAGNLPLVGFHDFLSVLISGNIFVGKLSSKNDKLLPAIINLLTKIEPKFKDYIHISENRLENFDSVIATGSNNSARYFEYYFGKYPHIIRKNRNSVAIISGNETDKDLQLLADDIFLYFGLGCRSVSKLFLPKDYDLDNIFRNSLKHKDIINHNKYANNYDYNRAIYLMNQTEFKDNGIMLMKEDINMASPISVVYYEYYSNIETIKQRLEFEKDKIQCIVTKKDIIPNAIPFGESQKPKLWDYADNVDTIEFLLSL